MLIIIALLLLETSVLIICCLFQHSEIGTLTEIRNYWQSKAQNLSDEIHELKEENCSLGQMIDERKTTIQEQYQKMAENEKTLRNIRECITKEPQGLTRWPVI
jgi:predicted  nucleic acid-binding Zn-ribbon protein